MADPTAADKLFYGRDWASCKTLVTVCDRNKVAGPIPHGLAPLKIKEKPTEIREPKDALYERAAELVSALRGLESHRKQGQVPCKHYAGIWIGCALQSYSQRGHDGVYVTRQHCRCLLNRHSRFLLFFSCKRHVLCDQVTSDRVSDPESIAPVGGDAEIALLRHSQFRNVVCPQGIVCVPLCAFSRLGAPGEFRSSYLCTVHGMYDYASPVPAGVHSAQKLYDIPRLGRRHTNGTADGP